jgi:hypothetical protein
LNVGIVVEHLNNHPRVEGSIPAAAALKGREISITFLNFYYQYYNNLPINHAPTRCLCHCYSGKALDSLSQSRGFKSSCHCYHWVRNNGKKEKKKLSATSRFSLILQFSRNLLIQQVQVPLLVQWYNTCLIIPDQGFKSSCCC